MHYLLSVAARILISDLKPFYCPTSGSNLGQVTTTCLKAPRKGGRLAVSLVER